jgi:hypothetical protein
MDYAIYLGRAHNCQMLEYRAKPTIADTLAWVGKWLIIPKSGGANALEDFGRFRSTIGRFPILESSTYE